MNSQAMNSTAINSKDGAAVTQKRGKWFAVALMIAVCAVSLAPKAAHADGAEAVVAVLVGAALLYAAQDDDKHHRNRVSYHFHDNGHRRCYERHGHGYGHRDYSRTYYVDKNNDHRFDRYYGDRRSGYANSWHRSPKYDRKVGRNDGKYYHKGNKHYAKGDRFDRGRDEGRRWNTQVPVH
ncbi:hypothetical protein NCG89_06745 [Spongiibacter taiwanensis]|uniref:hypothetical protein n=1 Tax=Spongiibacter taiwanensis TaxID=1748242 RepID=UPI002036577B|nr:hypothetical protein [Spongiibacter taiwanensis]USA44466.1 hypothetical protein NCG89_06745 [Spongiibacter taiwanensis]